MKNPHALLQTGKLCYTKAMEQKDQKRCKLKNRIAGTAAGAVAAASLTVGALFGAPEELLNVENGGDEPESRRPSSP